MTESVDRQTAATRLRAADDILILSHKNPDGDTIGSATGLCLALRALGKTAAVLCSDPIPKLYDYLDITWYDGSFEPAFVVAVDVASIQLFGENNNVQDYVRRANLCIDHHGSNAGYAYATLVEPQAAAVCEILTELIPDNLGVPLTPQIAACLYTGLATATGCFRFANTTARTHRVAAGLIEAGARVEELNTILFATRSRGQMEAERLARSHLTYELEGRCAVIWLDRDETAASGADPADLDELTALPIGIEGVQVGLTFRQLPGGSWRVSIRTAKGVDACAIARRLGGGGHLRAAGCELLGTLDNARQAVLAEARAVLDAGEEARP